MTSSFVCPFLGYVRNDIIVRLYRTGRTGERMVNATQMNRVFPLDPRALADAEYKLRTQVRQVVRFLQNNVPGFANARVNGSGTTTGVRESRRVAGDYVLIADDLFAGRRDRRRAHERNRRCQPGNRRPPRAEGIVGTQKT